MDDSLMALYMDVFVPSAKEWIRVDVEHARADNKARAEKKERGKVDRKKNYLGLAAAAATRRRPARNATQALPTSSDRGQAMDDFLKKQALHKN